MRQFEQGARLFSEAYRVALRRHKTVVRALERSEASGAGPDERVELKTKLRNAVEGLREAVCQARKDMCGTLRPDWTLRDDTERVICFSRTIGKSVPAHSRAP